MLFKIRHKEDGLYVSPGRYMKLTQNGKTWSKLAHVRAHIGCHRGYYNNRPGEFEHHSEVDNELADLIQRHEEAERQRNARYLKYRRQELQAELDRLGVTAE